MRLTALAALFVAGLSGPAMADIVALSDFDDGTVQGWTRDPNDGGNGSIANPGNGGNPEAGGYRLHPVVERVRAERRAAGPVMLAIYDVGGRRVATVVNEWQEAGAHEAGFDVASMTGHLYFARLVAGGASATAQFVRMK